MTPDELFLLTQVFCDPDLPHWSWPSLRIKEQGYLGVILLNLCIPCSFLSVLHFLSCPDTTAVCIDLHTAAAWVWSETLQTLSDAAFMCFRSMTVEHNFVEALSQLLSLHVSAAQRWSVTVEAPLQMLSLHVSAAQRWSVTWWRRPCRC